MPAQKSQSLHARLETLVALARLFEHADTSAVAVGADAYQALVRQLKAALAGDMPPQALKAVLDAFPSAAMLYENVHYAESGLSRSPLDRSVATEMMTSQLLHRIAARPPAGGAPKPA